MHIRTEHQNSEQHFSNVFWRIISNQATQWLISYKINSLGNNESLFIPISQSWQMGDFFISVESLDASLQLRVK